MTMSVSDDTLRRDYGGVGITVLNEDAELL